LVNAIGDKFYKKMNCLCNFLAQTGYFAAGYDDTTRIFGLGTSTKQQQSIRYMKRQIVQVMPEFALSA